MSTPDQGPYPAYPPSAPPGYPGGPPPGWGWRRPTNQLAVVALVLAFVFPPAALVAGIAARQQLRRTGEEGEGLALAAIVVGGVATTLMAVALLAWIGLVASLG